MLHLGGKELTKQQGADQAAGGRKRTPVCAQTLPSTAMSPFAAAGSTHEVACVISNLQSDSSMYI